MTLDLEAPPRRLTPDDLPHETLALARALLTSAPILILDEPCAGLDAETEKAFLLTLNDAAPGRSLILIAHRLTGVERLDRIFRLTSGHAVAATA